MSKRLFLQIAACTCAAACLNAQPVSQRRAAIVGGSPDRGKCTIEVVVDDTAEVEIRGDNAVLRTLSGQPAQWRRFQCNGVMPPDPIGFRFAGVDGRGRQDLVRDPRGGSPAVIRIQDSKGGAEGYTFDIFWELRGGGGPGFPPPDRGGYDRGPGRRFSTEEAIGVCKEEVRRQAFERHRGARDVEFRRVGLDDNPGRNDWVVGVIAVRWGPGREEPYRFACSVNFDSGRVRSAEITPMEGGGGGGYGGGGYGGRRSNRELIAGCQRAVEDRLHRDGFDRVDIRSIDVDNRPGRTDWILGTARAEGRYRPQNFDFSCRVSFETGAMLSVDVNRR